MFRWDREIDRLDIAARQVSRLYRSLGDIQVALAGLPSQEATAYVCAFRVDEGFRVIVALYLKESNRTAYYLSGEAPLNKAVVSKVMAEGIRFAESMGFMMGDTDFHLLDPAGKGAFWASMPLCKGAGKPSPEPKQASTAGPMPTPRPPGTVKRTGRNEVSEQKVCGQKTFEEDVGEEGSSDSPPASRPPVLYRKPPSASEMEGRRKQFLENLGRFLVSF